MARYKWDSAYEWLSDKAKGWDEARLYQELMSLARDADSDTLQDQFQSDMDADGYFNDLDICASLSRERCVEILEGISIECNDDEDVTTLRDAVEANLEDGTLAYGDVA